ncbi:MAG: HalD/BesD family halogenase [Candidatus Binatia bacterium]
MEQVMAERVDQPADLVDLRRYPILDAAAPRLAEVLRWARAQLRDTGACEVPAFLTPSGLAAVTADAAALEARAYRSAGVGTAYLEIPDFELPEDHPRRILGPASVGVVAYDMFPPASPLRRLYEWDPFMRFIEAVLQRGTLFRYADPLGALNLATMADGDELQWHFDQTDFVVSLAIRDAAQGGDFEVAPRIRSAGDERYPAVKRVLQGVRDDVVRLPMTPGTLLIFEGRYSLHRVSPIGGATSRLVGLLAYDTKPGTVSTEILRLARYGRAA